jgi:hypothetical protein
MRKTLWFLLALFLTIGVYQSVDASFFLTRYQNQRINGKTVHQTWNVIQLDLGEFTFGTEIGTINNNVNFKWVNPFLYHKIPFFGSGWKGGVRFEHNSLGNNSFAPSVRYAKVNEVWEGQNMLFLFQADYYLGDVERLELWGNITAPLFSEMPGFGLRLAAEVFFWASPQGERSVQLRFPRVGYRLPGFWKFNAITPAIMLEHQWDSRGTEEFVESNSVYLMVIFNF